MMKFFSPLFSMQYFVLFLTATVVLLQHNIEAQSNFLNKPSVSANSQSKISTQEKEEGIVFFTPPQNWLQADSKSLPPHVRVMVVGKGPSSFPPSINLSWEPYEKTLKDYLKTVKNINTAQGYDWKDLGTIQTDAGTGSLSQVDTKTQWGIVRLMHVILKKNGNIYILTASALNDEFSMFYKDFFSSMRSLRIAKDEYELVSDSSQRSQLKKSVENVKTQWKEYLSKKLKNQTNINEEIEQNLKAEVFDSQDFQKNVWNPFHELLQKKYQQYGAEWETLFLQKLEDQLFNLSSDK